MARQLLFDYLDRHQAAYTVRRHSVAYTAPEIAESSHITGHRVAKVVILKMDEELAMMVLPAHYHIALDILQSVLAVDSLRLASEREFSCRFPRCEIGAMPPFGHLYGLQTYMVQVFVEGQEIAFNAGNHTEIITMQLEEYLRLAHVKEITGGIVPPAITSPRKALLQAKVT